MFRIGQTVAVSLCLALLSGCGVGLCASSTDCSVVALSMQVSEVNFGVRGFGTLSDQALLISNMGSESAEGLSSAVTSSPFSFAGGSFPGTGGTCTNTLNSGATCTVVIRYTAPAPPEGSSNGTLTVNYSYGGFEYTLSIPLLGQNGNGSFNPSRGLDGQVNAITGSSGRVIIGGNFTRNTDHRVGSLMIASTSAPTTELGSIGDGLNGQVHAVALAADGSGKMYVGGFFSAYNGTTNINNIARLTSEGQLDQTFDIGTGASAGFNTIVRAIAPALDGSGDVYVGGDFVSYKGTANIRRIVRLNSDGSIDAGFNIGAGASAGFDAGVYAIAAATDGSGDVYVGGNFTAYNSTANINRIARFDSNGSRDAAFNIGAGATAGMNLAVFALVVAPDGSGDVYVAGMFTTYNSTANTNRIVRLNSNGTIDAGFNIGAGASAGFSAGSTSADTIAFANDGSGDVIVGGNFSSYNGTSDLYNIARLNTDGTLESTFNIGSGLTAGFNAPVKSVFPDPSGNGDIYVGGNFVLYAGTANILYLARINVNGSLDTEFNVGGGYGSGFDSAVQAIAPLTNGDVYVGGNFTQYNGTDTLSALIRLNSDGTVDPAFVVGVGLSGVTAIALAEDTSGDVYIGGTFGSYNGTTNVNYIARLNHDGSLDQGFDIGTGPTAGFDNTVEVIVTAKDGSGDVYVGGLFTTYRGTANIRGIVRLNSDGSIDSGFNIGAGASAGFNGFVYTICLAADGSGDVYVGGTFTSYNSTANIRYIVRLNSNGTIDSGFNIGSGGTAGFDSNVNTIAAATDGSGDVYVGGNFVAYNGTVDVIYITRLNSDGTIDTGFNTGTGGSSSFDAVVETILVAPDGDVYVGGGFYSYNTIADVNGIARLNPDGTREATFSTGTGSSSGFSYAPFDLALAKDGSGDLYVGGDFVYYDGAVSWNLARLSPTGLLD